MQVPDGYQWIVTQPTGQVLAFRSEPKLQTEDAFGSLPYPFFLRDSSAIELQPPQAETINELRQAICTNYTTMTVGTVGLLQI